MGARITAPRLEGAVTVRRGRKLGFAEFGAPGGRPIVWLHGTPGARRQLPESARLAATADGVRLIGIDRPGTGYSTNHLYESILDFVDDLRMVFDALALDQAAVIGLSGGGPYALAAGYGLADRVPVVGVLGGVAPTRGDDGVSGGLVGFADRFAPLLPVFRVPIGGLLTALIQGIKPIGLQALALYARISPPGDQIVFADPDIQEMFLDDLTGRRQQLRAPANDIVLFTRPWGFSVRDIRVPVKWWHGDSDNIVPLSHGERMVELLPDAELFIRPGESHLGGFAAAEEVLKTLIAAWDAADARS
ncbi:MAG TPA: alpha/beta hydrolase [Acidimicrobiales bacterium]|nr:alpha/beta hydrolase [Acidimicrobiales bacterium]